MWCDDWKEEGKPLRAVASLPELATLHRAMMMIGGSSSTSDLSGLRETLDGGNVHSHPAARCKASTLSV